jgi:uncharacterized lipoprotein YddW (UPF0748 family)
MKKLSLFLVVIFILSFLFHDKNIQCNSSRNVWVGNETSLSILILNKPSLFNNFQDLYIKSNLIWFSDYHVENSCHNIYAWFEDGLSLNYLTSETKKLVFSFKTEGKYWLDISKPKTREYILNKIKKFHNKYQVNIHLDDHWAIPKIYGNFETDLNNLTKKVFDVVGSLSISVLPKEYARNNYNVNWLYWLNNNLVNEIVLQNYVTNNIDLEIQNFHKLVKQYSINSSIGFYTGRYNKSHIESVNKLKMGVFIFSLRLELIQSILSNN